MGVKKIDFKKILKDKKFPHEDPEHAEELVKKLQLNMLRVQEGVWQNKKRVIILIEGFDAAGKGGVISRLVENLDPRGAHVYPYGPPAPDEQGRHYLYRFWVNLPIPGNISIFDRSWYGRVLVERVEKLTPKKRWEQAYTEINQLEKMLVDDGIDLVKIFLVITSAEQLRRFKQRLKDPYKQWKLKEDDIAAHRHWNAYVTAAAEMFLKTNTSYAPWHLILANDKPYARVKALETITSELKHHHDWLEKQVNDRRVKTLQKSLNKASKVVKSS